MIDAVAAALDDPRPLRGRPYDPRDPFWVAAAAHQVDFLLIDAARTGGAMRDWPDHAREHARASEVDAAALRTIRDRELAAVLSALAAKGIPSLLLKGAALAHLVYRHPHLRPRFDADLLVRPGDAAKLAAALAPLGYAPADAISGDYVSAQMQYDRRDCGDHRHALDIHWRLVNTHAVTDVPYDELAGCRVAVPALGKDAWTLSAPHALAFACVHRVAHHRDSDLLLWLWDIRLLADRLTDDDCATLAGIASRLGVRSACAHTLAMAASRFHIANASSLIERVTPPAGSPPEPSARFLRAGIRQVDVLQSDLSTLGWRRGAALLREHLFPSAAYMRTRYARWPPLLLPAAYLHRILMGAPKWLRRP